MSRARQLWWAHSPAAVQPESAGGGAATLGEVGGAGETGNVHATGLAKGSQHYVDSDVLSTDENGAMLQASGAHQHREGRTSVRLPEVESCKTRLAACFEDSVRFIGAGIFFAMKRRLACQMGARRTLRGRGLAIFGLMSCLFPNMSLSSASPTLKVVRPTSPSSTLLPEVRTLKGEVFRQQPQLEVLDASGARVLGQKGYL